MEKIKEPTTIRYLYDMKSVLYDQKWLKTAKDFEVYRFWRGEAPQEEWRGQEIAGLRYDITIIHPKMLGKEFAKTKGHRHKTDIPELFHVLEGEAFHFFQKGDANEIEDAYVVKAQPGDFVLLPPKPYEHLTINPSPKNRLVMANWLSPDNINDYSFFEKMRGACYYYTNEGWIKNEKYKKVPELRFVEALKEMPEDFKG